VKIVDLTLFRAVNLMAATFALVSFIRGCHVYNYKDVWDPSLDESVVVNMRIEILTIPMQLEQLFLIHSSHGSLELHHFVTTRNSRYISIYHINCGLRYTLW